MVEDGLLFRCEDVVFGYQSALMPALNWEVRRGEFWTILGSNGCGKSTLIRSLLGFVKFLDGKVSDMSKEVCYLAQRGDGYLDVPMSVYDMVRLSLDRSYSFLNPILWLRYRKRVRNVLESCDLWPLRGRLYSELSEGQKQRVDLGGLLVGEASLLFLDEATSAMDLVRGEEFYSKIGGYIQEKGAGCVSISHHYSLVREVSTHLLVFDESKFWIGKKLEVEAAMKSEGKVI